MPSNIVADLHLHSSSSDGEFGPAQIVAKAAERGLQVISLTDHDTISGVHAAIEAGKRLGVDVIPGCELTAYLGEVEIHILGLGIDIRPTSALLGMLSDLRARRPGRLSAMAEKLRALGVPVTDDAIQAEVGGSDSPGRAHLGAALVKQGFAASMHDAFMKYLSPGAPAYVAKETIHPVEIIRAIHSSGGLAILAHPAQYSLKRLGKSLIDEVLPRLLAEGLDGLEIYHHSHTPEDSKIFSEFAQRHGKFVSAGSDYHGPGVKPGIEVGGFGLSLSDYRVPEYLAELRHRSALA